MTKFSIMYTGSHPMQRYGELSRLIEDLEFDALYIADDLVFRPTWQILTVVAQNTKKLEIGPAIVSPVIVHPVYHATNLLAFDEMANGRAVCGLGKGGFNQMLSIPEADKSVRMMREALEVMKFVIAGCQGTYEGDYFNVGEEFNLHFQPNRTEIPITIGTWGPQMARMAGRHSDGLIAACTMKRELIEPLVIQTKEGAEAAGKDPSKLEIISAPVVSISEDPAAARRFITDGLWVFMPTMPLLTKKIGMTPEEVEKIYLTGRSGDLDAVEKMIPDEVVAAFTLTGTPKQIIPQIEESIAAGVTHFNFTPPHGPDVVTAINLLANEVVPYFRK